MMSEMPLYALNVNLVLNSEYMDNVAESAEETGQA